MSRFGQITRAATGGLSRFAQALGGGDMAERRAFDAETLNQSKLAQALAQIDSQRAAAEKDRAQTAIIAGRPALYRQQSALAAGVDEPTLDSFLQKQAGASPMVPMGPEAPDGSMGVGSAQFGPESSSRIAQALQRMVPLAAGSGDINPDQWAKALSSFSDADLRGDVLSGRVAPKTVALAQRAMAGGPAYDGAEYGVLDLFSGQMDTTNPAAQRFGDYRVSTTGAQKANAAQSYASARASDASADNSRASAAKTRAEMSDGVNRSGGKAPVGYRWGADGMTLEAIPGGPADPNTNGAKLSKPPTEGQAKSLMFAARMAASDDVIAEQEKAGVFRPGNIKATAQTVAGAVPLLGPALKSGAGALTNWTQSDGQQQVEQAQADFINAILRRESGAVISDQEFARAQENYFPEVGDTPARLRQKAANRKTAISGLKAEFGEALVPEFDRIVSEAKSGRKPTANSGSVSGSWGDEWKIERVP